MSTRDRALAALYGLATGDALGMPTQLMSRSAVVERFGRIEWFEAADANHPLAAGMAAASVTDDTEQALLLARLLIAGHGHVDAGELAQELVRWEDVMRTRGSLDLLGPSTRRAVRAVLAGEAVGESGRFGTTNGAAMRVTPVGIVIPSTDLVALVDRVAETASVSHNTGVAIAGASAVAAAVSAGIDGATLPAAFEVAITAAAIGSGRGYWAAAANVSRRIRWAIWLADPNDADRSLDDLHDLVGTSLATQESVPTAFGVLATFPDDPWRACLAAASLGGDSDTIAAIVGAIAGATHGTAGFPADALSTVARVNALDLADVVDGLLALR